MVSIGSKPDILVAEIRQEAFFSKIDEPNAITKGTKVKRILPKMLLKDTFEEVAEVTHDSL